MHSLSVPGTTSPSPSWVCTQNITCLPSCVQKPGLFLLFPLPPRHHSLQFILLNILLLLSTSIFLIRSSFATLSVIFIIVLFVKKSSMFLFANFHSFIFLFPISCFFTISQHSFFLIYKMQNSYKIVYANNKYIYYPPPFTTSDE